LDIAAEKKIGRLMVVGAHVRTRLTDVDKFDPPVPSVVASRDHFAKMYSGSIRILRTFTGMKPYDAADTKKKLGRISAAKKAVKRH
jgi:hypothetical protein